MLHESSGMLWCCYSVAKCPALHELMDCSTPGSPVLPCLPECALSRWCRPAISPTATPFSFCLQSFPASGSFPVSQLFTSGGQSVGASASESVLPVTIQGWFPLGWTGLILQSKGLTRVFCSTTVWKHRLKNGSAFESEARLPTCSQGKDATHYVHLPLPEWASKMREGGRWPPAQATWTRGISHTRLWLCFPWPYIHLCRLGYRYPVKNGNGLHVYLYMVLVCVCVCLCVYFKKKKKNAYVGLPRKLVWNFL